MENRMQTTCGVLITDGSNLLVCHPTNGIKWDIPKGKQDIGEDDVTTACRELWEETGLRVDPDHLVSLGTYPYKPSKQLSLFLNLVTTMPDVNKLLCHSYFETKDGKKLPEMNAYLIVSYAQAMSLLNADMCRVVKPLLDNIST